MERNNKTLTILICLLGLAGAIPSEGRAAVEGWQRVLAPVTDPVRAIEVEAADPRHIWIGTRRGVWYSADGGSSAVPVFFLSGQNQQIRDMAWDQRRGVLYVAADGALYAGRLGPGAAKTWEQEFVVRDPEQDAVYAVLTAGPRVYLGTQDGLYIREGDQAVWRRDAGELGHQPIFALARGRDAVYAATADEVFRLGPDGQPIRRVFSASGVGVSVEAAEDADAESALVREGAIKALAGSPDQSRLVLADDRGIWSSRDRGETWQAQPGTGLAAADVRRLMILGDGPGTAGDGIIAATRRGVYRLHGAVWQPLYQGLAVGAVDDIAALSGSRLWVGTDQGVYGYRLAGAGGGEAEDPAGDTALGAAAGAEPVVIHYAALRAELPDEPTIQQVQELAIDYAEVSADKIRQWRALARRRAWLPDLSVGIDEDRNITRSDSLWGTYTSGGQYYQGPDDKTAYNNMGWGVSLSWDLGDLVWSTDQTTIDSRSKMMVELREDILDQLTRLYFERRRIQVILLSRQGQVGPDTMDQQLRVEELTAMIDALTGGQFSRLIQQRQDTQRDAVDAVSSYSFDRRGRGEGSSDFN